MNLAGVNILKGHCITKTKVQWLQSATSPA